MTTKALLAIADAEWRRHLNIAQGNRFLLDVEGTNPLRERLVKAHEKAAACFRDLVCPYAGGRWEDGKMVGFHALDCQCEIDGLIR